MTAVPAALQALKARSEVAAPNVLVIKGQPKQRPSVRDVVIIGYAGEGPAVEYADDIAGLGSARQQFDVTSLISVLRGDENIDLAIDRADELLEALLSELRADQTLGGAVTRTRLTSLSHTALQVSGGALAEIEFTVRVDTFR